MAILTERACRMKPQSVVFVGEPSATQIGFGKSAGDWDRLEPQPRRLGNTASLIHQGAVSRSGRRVVVGSPRCVGNAKAGFDVVAAFAEIVAGEAMNQKAGFIECDGQRTVAS